MDDETNKTQKKSVLTKFLNFLNKSIRIKDFICTSFIFKPPTLGYEFEWKFDENTKINSLGVFLISNLQILAPLIVEENLRVFPTYIEFSNKSPMASDRIATVFIQNTEAESDMCVIYSHGNASDISNAIFYAQKIALLYRVNVLIYDYRGYGQSKGEISEKNMYEDLENVLSYANIILNFRLEKIILWGFSLGSAPTIEIASRYQDIGGVILQAPIASLLVWTDKKATWDYTYSTNDMFCNINKIENLKSKIFIIHGKKDNIITPRHSFLLYERFIHIKGEENNQIWFILAEECGHNDLQSILEQENEFSKRVMIFLKMVREDSERIKCAKEKEDNPRRLRNSFLEREINSLKLCADNFKLFSEDLEKKIE